MRQTMTPTAMLMFAIGVSLFGLFASLMLALCPPTIQDGFFWRKPLIGLTFGLICVFGIFAAVFPGQCAGAFHFRSRIEKHPIEDAPSIALKGHHPDCGKFSTHVMHIRGCTLCSACAGLSLGALAALVGTAFYFFGGWRVDELSLSAVLIGIVAVVLGFLQLKFSGAIRLGLNTLFVLGAFLILVGIDALVQSLFVDTFLIMLIAFWLLTRIMLSQWDHSQTCQKCESKCEIYVQRKGG